jgi:hypothetical protein
VSGKEQGEKKETVSQKRKLFSPNECMYEKTFSVAEMRQKGKEKGSSTIRTKGRGNQRATHKRRLS